MKRNIIGRAYLPMGIFGWKKNIQKYYSITMGYSKFTIKNTHLNATPHQIKGK